MKLRNIFTALTAALALTFAGCQEEERFLDEVQVSQSMVSLSVEGDQVEVTVTATEDWAFAEIKDVWPTLVTRDKDGKVVSEEPSWLSVDKMSGTAGETVVVFSAEATTETRELTLNLNCGKVSQVINVLQMAAKVEVPLTSCATVLAENNVGKVYKVKGTITDLTNYDKYGCFYVNDGTATVYVYGSMNSAQFKPEVGDIITFEGPWTSYGNFDDATIVSLEKSLLKVEKVFPEEALPLEGGTATVLLTVKEGELEVVIPEDAAWLTAGEPGTLGGMTSVELTAAANEGGARTATVTFKVNVDGKDYLGMVDIEQLGAIAEVSVADFLAAPEGTSLYKLTGKVANLQKGDYGNFDLVDATGSVYVYGLTATPVEKNDKSFPTLGIKEGDIVTLIGTRTSYKDTPQVGGPAYYVSHVGHTESTVADFLAQSVAADKWYKLTGKITNLQAGDYGNFDLVDETGTVYVYGITVAPVAKNDKSFPKLGLKEGDIVTLVGTRAEYKGTAQVGGPAYYISHEEGAPAVDPWETAASFTNGADATDDALMKEIKAYADATNLYVRVTSVAALDGANYLDVNFCDGNGTASVWWGWTTTGTNLCWNEHEGAVDAEGNLVSMLLEDKEITVKTEKTADGIMWYLTYPREAVAKYVSSGKTYVSALLWKDWGAYWAVPARGNAMLEVTLP